MKKILLLSLLVIPIISISQTTTLQFTEHLIESEFQQSAFSRVVDLDDDDDMDIVATAYNGDELAWFENDGQQNFTKHLIAGNYDGAYYFYIEDIDGDNDLDIYAGANLGYNLFINDGNQQFSPTPVQDITESSFPTVYDMDGDSDIDFLVYNDTITNQIIWYENTGNMNFIQKTIPIDLSNTRIWKFGDLDGDKDLDIFALDTVTDQYKWFENINSQNFVKYDSNFDNDHNDSTTGYINLFAEPDDVNGDGILDMLATYYSGENESIAWHENDGNQNYTRHIIDADINYPFWISAADLDKDNDMDIIATAYVDGRVFWYENDGEENFTKHTLSDQINSPLSHFTGDLDNDDDDDVLINGYLANNVLWYENNYTATPRTYANLSANENYVYTLIARKAAIDEAQLNEDDDVIESVTYFDGLGRPKQQIGIKQSPSKKDIITHIEYDAFGRQAKDYLPHVPITPGNEGSFKTANQNGAIDTYYQTHYPADLDATPNPYSEKVFEASPLNRVLEQAAPGKDWKAANNHTIKFDYQTNIASEVKLYEVSFLDPQDTETPSLVENGFYTENELYKTITKDENWSATQTNLNDHTTEEFKDKQGRIILKRTYNSSSFAGGQVGEHNTYYTYDDFGNLTYVIPPKAAAETTITQEILEELCYQYKYDHRNRLVEKKIPGKGWEYIIYDKLDRPILTQDANLRLEVQGYKWLFTKYDALGRVIYTGISGMEETRKGIQTWFNEGNYPLYETKTTTPLSIGGAEVYYTNNSGFPSSTLYFEVHSVNYYDDYNDFDLAGAAGENPGNVFGITVTDNTKGLPTCSKVKVLGKNKWITTVTYYDNKARPIYVFSKNKYLNTRDIIKSQLDFTGNVTKTITRHFKGQNAVIKTTDFFTYDHANRLIDHKQKIGNQDKELITQNTYDELGQLTSKAVGNKPTGTRLQNIDYTYNIRGWLKNINDPENSLANDDLFAFGINYNTITLNNSGNSKLNTEPLYNGNISETIWRTANDDKKRAYGYKYDALNRLDKARYKAGDNLNSEKQFFDVKNINYDVNGNITKLVRKSPNAAFDDNEKTDNLVYKYKANGLSNKLKKVTDNTGLDKGFKDGNTTGLDYVYDANGNLTKDKNKGITKITYNHLNLPTLIKFGDGNKIKYFYDASGIKLRKKVFDNGNETITDYAGNYVYENNNLQFFNHAEGYITPNGSSFNYIYQYKDHLGNVRLSYSDANGDGAITTSEIIEENNYYPFGLKHKGYNSNVSSSGNSVAQKRKFGGNELQDELGLEWYDITARNYDPALGRWMNLDPLAELMRRHSPYNYAFDNPAFFIDPDGMAPLSSIGGDDEFSRRMELKSRQFDDSMGMFGNAGNINNSSGGGDCPDCGKTYSGPGAAVGSGVTNLLDEVVVTASSSSSSNFFTDNSPSFAIDGLGVGNRAGEGLGTGRTSHSIGHDEIGIGGGGAETGSGFARFIRYIVDLLSHGQNMETVRDEIDNVIEGSINTSNTDRTSLREGTFPIVKENSRMEPIELLNGNIVQMPVRIDTTINMKNFEEVVDLSTARLMRKLDSVTKSRLKKRK